MDKKTPYVAYCFAAVPELTHAQIKANNPLPAAEIGPVVQWMDKNNIYGIVQGESGRHRRLTHVPASPAVLFVQGSLDILNKPVLAVVGPRSMSAYAQEIMYQLFEYLQYCDIVTISGLAPGVDTMCHRLSLQYNIPTVAVLGGGFSYFLRGRKREMIEEIIGRGGAVMSEYKHGFAPTKRSFPQRNRIIAGLADMVFLPEAQEKSGSLITADIAYDIGKPVYAVMQSIFAESSKGTNTYIAARKIKPVADLEAFVESRFAYVKQVKSEVCELSEEEKNIINLFDAHDEITTEMIVEKTMMSDVQIMMYISVLEMKGYIYIASPDVYRKKVCIRCRKP